MNLLSGFARIQMAGGAKVLVEGPARFTAESGNRIALASGKAAAEVPPRAKGFTIRTPVATVIDLGTEFGVDAADPAGTRVQVFTGQVNFTASSPAGRPAPGAQTHVATGGGAYTIGGLGAVESVEFDESAFVRPAELADLAAAAAAQAPPPAQLPPAPPSSAPATAAAAAAAAPAPAPAPAPAAVPEPEVVETPQVVQEPVVDDSPLGRWRRASEALRRDPGLALYYTFEKETGPAANNAVRNLAASTAGRYDLRLDATKPAPPVPMQGRWPGKDGLQFHRGWQQALLLPEYPIAPARQLSVSAWVYADRKASFASIAKSWGTRRFGQFYFGLATRDGDLCVWIQEGPGKQTTVREGKDKPLPLRRWVHVAFVCDGQTLVLYRDGRKVAETPSAGPTPNPQIRALGIGFKTGDGGQANGTGETVGHWDGLFDELALFHRPLSADEVREMYDAGRPTEQP